MTDVFSKFKRSEVMSRIRSKNTLIEKRVFRFLRTKGVVFKKHYTLLPGKPDVVVFKLKKIIFIDGDFWHGYRYPLWGKRKPIYWQMKIERNRARDKRNFSKLRRRGWKVMRIWEHQLKKDFDNTMTKALAFLVK